MEAAWTVSKYTYSMIKTIVILLATLEALNEWKDSENGVSDSTGYLEEQSGRTCVDV